MNQTKQQRKVFAAKRLALWAAFCFGCSIVNANAQAPTVSNVLFDATVGRYEIVEISFASSNDPYGNPFDPAVVEAAVTVTAPSGTTTTVVAFWYQDYQPAGGAAGWETYSELGAPHWLARFAPRETGAHSFTISIQDSQGGGLGNDPAWLINVTPSSHSGFVGRHPASGLHLAFSNGRTYLPIGHNTAFHDGASYNSADGTALWNALYQRMGDSGENWTRFWMTDFDRTALEGEAGLWSVPPNFFDYQGLGRYSLKAAWRVDQKLAAAQARGVYVQLVLHDHGQFSTDSNARWDSGFSPNVAFSNPYNSATTGGLVADPNDFFGDAQCRGYVKQRLRYIIARYGAYRGVLAWELFNEVQYTGNGYDDSFRTAYNDPALQAAVETWHAEMAQYLKTNDPYGHLVTTSSEDDWKARNPALTDLDAVWADPNIDLVQLHHYRTTAWNGQLEVYDREIEVAYLINILRARFGKPVWCGEFGIGDLPLDAAYGGGYCPPEVGGQWDLDGYDPTVTPGFYDPPLTTDINHLNQGTHLHNMLWMGLVNQSLAAYWWWGEYIDEDPVANRTAARGFPLYYHFRAARAFLQAAQAERWPEWGMTAIIAGATGGVRPFVMRSADHAVIYAQDENNGFGTGFDPGDLANRTIAGATVTVTGMSADTEFQVFYYDTWDGATPLAMLGEARFTSTAGGDLTLTLPAFQRDLAIVVGPVTGETAVSTPAWFNLE